MKITRVLPLPLHPPISTNQVAALHISHQVPAGHLPTCRKPQRPRPCPRLPICPPTSWTKWNIEENVCGYHPCDGTLSLRRLVPKQQLQHLLPYSQYIRCTSYRGTRYYPRDPIRTGLRRAGEDRHQTPYDTFLPRISHARQHQHMIQRLFRLRGHTGIYGRWSWDQEGRR